MRGDSPLSYDAHQRLSRAVRDNGGVRRSRLPLFSLALALLSLAAVLGALVAPDSWHFLLVVGGVLAVFGLVAGLGALLGAARLGAQAEAVAGLATSLGLIGYFVYLIVVAATGD
jgi:hypothetical protein